MILAPQTIRDAHETQRSPRCDDQGHYCVVPPASGLPTQFFLTSAGDGTGEHNLNGNYSGTETDFKFVAPYEYFIYSALVSITDNALFTLTDYGGGVTLTNGVTFLLKAAAGYPTIPLLGGKAFKSNADWMGITAHVVLTSFAGLSQALTVDFDMWSDYGCPLRLGTGGEFIVRLHDNFSGLVTHSFGLRGTRYLA